MTSTTNDQPLQLRPIRSERCAASNRNACALSSVSALQSRYPGIKISLRVLDNDSVLDAVINSEVDFGIFFEPNIYRDLTVRTFAEVVLGFIAPTEHPLSSQSWARFSVCADTALIVPAEPLAVAQQIAILEGRTGLIPDKVVTCDNVQMMTSLVLQGAGIGILTSLDVIAEVDRGLLSFIKISDTILRPITLARCTATSQTPSYAAEPILGQLEDGFARFGYRTAGQFTPDVTPRPS